MASNIRKSLSIKKIIIILKSKQSNVHTACTHDLYMAYESMMHKLIISITRLLNLSSSTLLTWSTNKSVYSS